MLLKRAVKKANFLIILCWIFLLLNPFPTPAYAADEKASDTYEEKLLHTINQYRDRHDTPPLIFDRTLHILAEDHSHYMRGSDKLSHTNFEDRYKQCKRNICVENVGWNYMTPEDQFEAWRESKGHNINMLNTQIRRAGISKVGPYVTFFACD